MRTSPIAENSTIAHHINQAIKAHGTMKRDIDYVVKDGEVIIVDEFTGRLMFGRRYSEGLHQAIEAKEGVNVAARDQDAGDHHLPELLPPVQEALRYDRYSADRGGGIRRRFTTSTSSRSPPTSPSSRVSTIPTWSTRPRRQSSTPSSTQIKECHAKGQPVLVGTVSIEKNEQLSNLLKPRGHQA